MVPPSISPLPSNSERTHSKRILRLAILETDPELVTANGTFADLFRRLFTNSITEAEERLEKVELYMQAFNVVENEFPNPDKYDGLLVTGSRATAFDNDPWILNLISFIRNVSDNSSARLIGICFGHQVIARALGGVVEENPAGWEVSVCKLQLDDDGLAAKLFPEAAIEGKLLIQEMHRDHVSVAPPGVQVFARTDKSPIQGLYSENKLLTLQGHPEFSAEVVRGLIGRQVQNGNLSDDEALDSLSRAGLKNHGEIIGKAVIRFLTGAV